MGKNHLVNYIVSAASLVSIKGSFLYIPLSPPGGRVRVNAVELSIAGFLEFGSGPFINCSFSDPDVGGSW
jgi:hypothetical protein